MSVPVFGTPEWHQQETEKMLAQVRTMMSTLQVPQINLRSFALYMVSIHEGEWWVMEVGTIFSAPLPFLGPFMTQGGAERALEAHRLSESLLR